MATLGLALAGMAAKTVYNLWASNSLGSELPNGLIDLVTASLGQDRDRRAAKRQIDGLTEAIFDSFEPLLEHELAGLDDGEKATVVESVRQALDVTVVDAKVVTAAGLDPEVLEQLTRPSDSQITSLGLSEAGLRLHDLLLTEACAYIVQIASGLPNFESRAAQEILRREAALMTLANETLQALPRSPVPNSWGSGDDHARFETKYLRKVASSADRLELFGVSSPTARRPYELSVAYISLAISHPAGSIKAPVDSTDTSTRAEEYFDSHQRVLLLGDAGSGKTTLLRWLATAAARRPNSASNGSSWQNRVPFIIALRQFADRPLPRPEEYVSLTAPNMAAVSPPGWAHSLLNEGRAALLVDGLDELAVDRRDEVLTWLSELDKDFPGNAILVTSRGAAIENTNWKTQAILEPAALQQMDSAQIQSFVNHWHEAMSKTATDDEKQAVRDANVAMLNVVRTRVSIRNLSQTPLLCALMCALHLENAASLPNDRMSLYRTALEMLVMKRDNDRKLARSDNQLSLSDRLILLKRLALWMHENGYAEITTSDYRASIARTLPALNLSDWGVSDTAQFLLERCGVLREPYPGTIDFVHRSFLEYLAAAAEIDDDSIQKLLKHATEEPWREVIVLANGHANNAQRSALLTGLLDQGQNAPSERHVLFLLAIACMQTAPSLDIELRQRLQKALGQVVPPSSMGEAAAVAAAGDSAAPLLKRANLKVMEAVASVRALSLIGTAEALESLKSYRRETRVTVIRQLIRAWAAFDAETYAKEVLIDSRFIRGHYTVTELEHVPFLALFERLESIDLEPDERLTTWDELRSVENDSRVVTLVLPSTDWMTDLAGVPPFPELTYLRARANFHLETLSGIDKLSSLRAVELTAINLHSLNGLASLPHLASLTISSLRLTEFTVSDPASRILDLVELNVGRAFASLGTEVPTRVLRLNLFGELPRPDDREVDVTALASSTAIEELELGDVRLPEEVLLPASVTHLSVTQTATKYLGATNLTKLTVGGRFTEEIWELIDQSEALMRIHVSNLLEEEETQRILARMPDRPHLRVSFFSFNPLSFEGVERFVVEPGRYEVSYVHQ